MTASAAPSAGPSVGNEASRAVHGYTAGADVVLLGAGGAGGAGVAASLAGLGLGERPVHLTGSLPELLRSLAEVLCAGEAAPAVVAAADLDISGVALLDLLDRPGVRTAALVADPFAVAEGRDEAARVRVGGDGRLVESVGTAAHAVSDPTHALPGVLRIAAGDRAEAARLLREAAGHAGPAWGSDAVAVVLLVLVRGGLPVQASGLGPFDWSRGAVRAKGAAGDPWRQRLRGASRGGDGFFSTFAVRPLSRRLTAVGLAHGWTPNGVTVVSLVLGLVAAGLVATGAWWAWVVAAVLLLAALVVDCVDGEIARFTRRFSPLGAFLDAVGDRVKEYAVVAAVAAVAVREGEPGWPLAVAVLAAVTVRHLEDYAYEHRLGFARRSNPVVLPVDEAGDGGPAGARGTLPEPAGRRARAVHWAKKVVHLPIAERYLLIALTLLTRRPMLVLWTLLVAVVVAVLWTQGGRVVRVLVRRDPSWSAVTPGSGPGHLDHQLDLGPVARLAGRLGRATFPVGLAGAGVLTLLVPLALWFDSVGAALALALVGSALVGLGWQSPVHHPLGWQAPAALWVAEVLVVGLVVHHVVGVMSAAAYAYLSAVAYHRYDVVYRLRDTGTPPAPWLTWAGGGTDGRLIVVLLLALLAPGAVVPVLWALALLLAALYLGESIRGWRTWIAGQRAPQAGVQA